MTPEQIALVQQSWAKVAPIADTAADIFYTRLFEIAPEVRPMFKDDMSAQKKALMGMLATAVNGLPRLDELVPAVQAMGARHAGYGVKAEHYEPVGAALIYTLDAGLGEDFTPAVREAWTQAYITLSTVMIGAASNAVA